MFGIVAKPENTFVTSVSVKRQGRVDSHFSASLSAESRARMSPVTSRSRALFQAACPKTPSASTLLLKPSALCCDGEEDAAYPCPFLRIGSTDSSIPRAVSISNLVTGPVLLAKCMFLTFAAVQYRLSHIVSQPSRVPSKLAGAV